MYNSFELFFFWRKCGTVVAVGVQTSFCNPLPPWKVGTAKSVTEKKQQQGGLCGGRQKDRASPALRHAQRADEKGWGFLAADGCPVADRNKLSGKAWPFKSTWAGSHSILFHLNWKCSISLSKGNRTSLLFMIQYLWANWSFFEPIMSQLSQLWTN